MKKYTVPTVCNGNDLLLFIVHIYIHEYRSGGHWPSLYIQELCRKGT